MGKHFWRGKRVFITGATGFKGSWLALTLKIMGAKVTGIGLLPEPHGIFEDIHLDKLVDIDFIDIRNYSNLARSLTDCNPEIIFHLAAQPLVSVGYEEPRDTIETNILGTTHLLEAALRLNDLNSIVNITTDKVYRNQEKAGGYSEDDPLGGHDPYSASKAGADIISSSYYHSFFKERGIGLSNARSGNVLGGGDVSKDRLVPDYYRAIREKKKLKIRFPEAVRPWQHILDPLAGYICLAEKMSAAPGQFSSTWNFGPDRTSFVTVEELFLTLSSLVDRPPDISVERSEMKETELLFLKADKAKKSLGWSPKIDFQTCLRMLNQIESAKTNAEQLEHLYKQQICSYFDLSTNF